ncbi:MAG: DUF63 family protein [Candidatus Aenigmatarchaeota archaeon]
MVSEWFTQKFIEPLCRYYTLEATIVYAIILALAVYGTYVLLRKLKVGIDKSFFIGVLPFIIFGGWTRALRDHGLYEGWWWCSPPIYFIVFAVALGSLLMGLWIQRKKILEYHKLMLAVGSVLLLYNLVLTQVTNWSGFITILGIAFFWAIIFFGIHKYKPKLLSVENAGIVVAHLFDASATFTAMTFFGYYEQHVLPTFLINIFGPGIMFVLKIAVVLPVLMIIDRYSDDKFFPNFLKIIILILGLALGIRGLLTVSL